MIWVWISIVSLGINAFLLWKLIEADTQYEQLYCRKITDSQFLIEVTKLIQNMKALQKEVDAFRIERDKIS